MDYSYSVLPALNDAGAITVNPTTKTVRIVTNDVSVGLNTSTTPMIYNVLVYAINEAGVN